MKAQLKMADRSGARYAAILGEREVSAGEVTLRRLDDGVQESVSTEALAEQLLRRGAETGRSG